MSLKKYFLCLSLLLFSFNALSQSFSYRKYNYQWSTVNPAPIEVEDKYKNQDAVILSDELIYNASGNKVPLYNNYYQLGNYYIIGSNSEGITPIIQRFIRIKFLSKEGITKGSKFSLPESFDPVHDKLLTSTLDTLHRFKLPVGEFNCIRYFAGRIVKPDGKIIPATISEEIEDFHRSTSTRQSTFYEWNFTIQNLEPGDELQLDYSYEGSYTFEPSNKIYFNGIFPKENFKLCFREALVSNKMILCHNGAEILDTIINKNLNVKSRDYNFVAKDLKGGIDEVGAFPVKELPYITFYDHHMDYVKENTNSVLNIPIAYPWYMFLAKNLNYRDDDLKLHILKQDKKNIVLTDYFNNIKALHPNSNTPLLMSFIQHDVNENFLFDNDVNYIDGTDGKLEKLGNNIEEKKLRYISRFNFYSELLLRLDTVYYLGFVGDKRTDRFDIDKYEPIGLSSEYFAIPFGNSYIFYYPKGSRFGYETNEFPFYHEGTIIELANQHLPVENKLDIVPNIAYPVSQTPTSSVKDNTRITNGMASISFSSLAMKYSGKTILRGQFSTLIRGYYLYGSQDTTVNPKYYQSFNDLKPLTTQNPFTKNTISNEYPFESSFNVNFSNVNFLTKESENTFSFNLDGWFNDITDNNFTARNRQLSYYPDFKFQDTHKFYLKFDKPIKLDTSFQLADTIKNSLGYYLVNLEQKDPTSIIIYSDFVVPVENVKAENAMDVQNIYSAIDNMNKRKYIIAVAEK